MKTKYRGGRELYDKLRGIFYGLEEEAKGKQSTRYVLEEGFQHRRCS